jgi:hypothetical protein
VRNTNATVVPRGSTLAGAAHHLLESLRERFIVEAHRHVLAQPLQRRCGGWYFLMAVKRAPDCRSG